MFQMILRGGGGGGEQTSLQSNQPSAKLEMKRQFNDQEHDNVLPGWSYHTYTAGGDRQTWNGD